MAPPWMIAPGPAQAPRRLENLLFLHALASYRGQAPAHLFSPLTLSTWVEAVQQRGVLARA